MNFMRPPSDPTVVNLVLVDLGIHAVPTAGRPVTVTSSMPARDVEATNDPAGRGQGAYRELAVLFW
jgi:hypothetical protein